MDAKVIRQKVQLFIDRNNLELTEGDKQTLFHEVVNHELKIESLGTKLRASKRKDRYDETAYKAYMQALEDYAVFEQQFVQDHKREE